MPVDGLKIWESCVKEEKGGREVDGRTFCG